MTEFRLRAVTPDAQDRAFNAWSEITLVCERAIFGSGHTAFLAHERAAAIKLDTTVAVTPLLARLGDEPVGAGLVELSLLDNLHFASLEVCIAPQFRRRGYGTKLLLELTRLARDAGRNTLNVHHTWPLGLPNPAEAFAAAHGFSPALTEYRSDLLLPSGSLDPLLVPLERAAAAPAANYEVLTWIDELPPQWAEPRAKLAARMVLDAPLGELDLAAEVWDAQRVQQIYQVAQAQGRRVLESIAVHRPSAQAVGYTTAGGLSMGHPGLGGASGASLGAGTEGRESPGLSRALPTGSASGDVECPGKYADAAGESGAGLHSGWRGHRMAAGLAQGLVLAESNPGHTVVWPFREHQRCAAAGGLDVLAQVGGIRFGPNTIRDGGGLAISELSIAMEVGLLIRESGCSKPEESVHVPAAGIAFPGVHVDREIKEVTDGQPGPAASIWPGRLEHVEAFHQQDIRLLHELLVIR
jgi:GNAT superfamily N-acetyltransferase